MQILVTTLLCHPISISFYGKIPKFQENPDWQMITKSERHFRHFVLSPDRSFGLLQSVTRLGDAAAELSQLLCRVRPCEKPSPLVPWPKGRSCLDILWLGELVWREGLERFIYWTGKFVHSVYLVFILYIHVYIYVDVFVICAYRFDMPLYLQICLRIYYICASAYVYSSVHVSNLNVLLQ